MLKKLLACLTLLAVVACSGKSFDKKITLKPVPNIVLIAEDEAKVLRDYADKINQIDDDKIISQLKDKAEREKFKYRIVDLKVAYNKCVDKLQEVEKVHPKDKIKKNRELKEYISELDAIWKYIVVNYKV